MKAQRKADVALSSSREIFKKIPQSARGSVSKRTIEQKEKFANYAQERRDQYLQKDRGEKTGCSTGRNSRRTSNVGFDAEESSTNTQEKQVLTNATSPLQCSNNRLSLTQGKMKVNLPRTTSVQERKSLKPKNTVSNNHSYIFSSIER